MTQDRLQGRNAQVRQLWLQLLTVPSGQRQGLVGFSFSPLQEGIFFAQSRPVGLLAEVMQPVVEQLAYCCRLRLGAAQFELNVQQCLPGKVVHRHGLQVVDQLAMA
ncbi:hypothetical protein D3C78_980870 [compost metagenome]